MFYLRVICLDWAGPMHSHLYVPCHLLFVCPLGCFCTISLSSGGTSPGHKFMIHLASWWPLPLSIFSFLHSLVFPETPSLDPQVSPSPLYCPVTGTSLLLTYNLKLGSIYIHNTRPTPNTQLRRLSSCHWESFPFR